MPTIESKPFPWKCGHCGQRAVRRHVGPYSAEMEYDGRTYKFDIDDLETPRCEECGAMVLDDAANRRISAELRKHLGLLAPEQIRRNREALDKTQKQMASSLGIAEATLSRWETGAQIQQRAMDRLLRLFFGSEQVRSALADEAHLSEMGAFVEPSGR
jgi:putative zinc finger/helix-turn-helix YgiT family protein